MMRRIAGSILVIGCSVAQAQFGRGTADWATIGADAQRSSWVRTDPKITKDSILKPDFRYLWKIKLNNQPVKLNSLGPIVLLDHYIGYRGFRSLAFVGGSSDNVYAIDTDLGRIEWQVHLAPATPPSSGSADCPGGMTANVTRLVATAYPTAASGRGGRGGPARSGVGEPGEGAVTIAEVMRTAAAMPAGRGATPAAPGRGPGAPGRGPVRMASYLYVLTGDGLLHSMYVSNGFEPEPAIRFLPANANAAGLTVIDNVAYAATANGCGGAQDGMWALDLASKEVTKWKADRGLAGSAGPAFGPDGTIYAATKGGELAALEPKTLAVKDTYSAKQAFTSSPVVFQYKQKNLVAAATKDGSIHLLDAAAPGGADHRTPLYKTPARSDMAGFEPGALASWQDPGGVRWILAPTSGSIVAWKVVDENGALSLQPGWVSRDMISPLPPMVINGVVFAASSGAAQRSSPAVIYALDGATGKELWNSGKTIASFVHGGALSGGESQLYLGTHDGTFYAFGFWIEH